MTTLPMLSALPATEQEAAEAPSQQIAPELVRELSRLLGQLQSGTVRTAPTVAEIWEAYRVAKKGKLASFETYRFYAPPLLAFFGSRRADSLTLADVDAYRNLRRDAVTQFGRSTKPATRNREVAFLKTMLNFAVERSLLTYNPIAKAEHEEENNTRETVLTEEQVSMLCERASDVIKAMILVSYDGGLRRNEVVTLRWDQLDLQNGLIHLWMRGTKTRQGRVTVLSDRTIEAIRALPRDHRCPWVFMNPRTLDHFRPYYFYKELRTLVERADLRSPDGRPYVHDLRRSWCTISRRRNLPESMIKRMGGWTTDEVFHRYNIIAIDDFTAARARLEVARAEDLKRLPFQQPSEGETPTEPRATSAAEPEVR